MNDQKHNPKNMASVEAQLAAAEAQFDADNFSECKTTCVAALSRIQASTEAPAEYDAVSKRLKQIVKKCDLNLMTPSHPAVVVVAPPSATVGEAPQSVATHPVAPPHTPVDAASTSKPTPAAAVPPSALPVAAPRFEWFQSPTTVTLTFYIKGRSDADLGVDATDRSITVCIRLGDNRDYTYTVETLYGTIDAAKITKSVRPTKIEVVLPKAAGGGPMWPTIEMKGGDLVTTHSASHAPSASQSDLQYPSSKGKDWNKWKLTEEEEKSLSTEDGTNAFFKQIFGNGSDEQRRAMMKSYVESGGTVLSTNWQDVGSRHVQGEAPKGMEMKQWGKDS